MTVYVLVDITIDDPAGYEAYAREVFGVVERYGGRYLVRGGPKEVLERHEWQPQRLVVLEFPDMDAVKRWYDSDDYRPLREIRQRTARATMVAVEGL